MKTERFEKLFASLVDVVYPDDLEDFISEALFNSFDTIVQDGSLGQVFIFYMIRRSLPLIKSKLPPRSGSVALRQLNPIHKKGP